VPPQEEWERTCAEALDDALDPPAGPVFWNPTGNTVEGNVLADNRQADIILAALDDVSTMGNCFAGNTLSSSTPAGLESLAPCGGPVAPQAAWEAAGTYDVTAWLAESEPPSVDFRTAPLPPLEDQEQMPGAADAPARPAIDMPPFIDVEAIAVPARSAT
jgi:hypothetical protein